MVLATRIVHIHRVFLDTIFQIERVLIVDVKEILHFKVVGLKLRSCIEEDCYEHIPLVKSEEIRQ